MLNLQDIQIPRALDAVVDNSLHQVRRLHRRALVRRTGIVCTSLVSVFGAFLIFGFTNPALASQIPLLGSIFRQANSISKMPGGENIEGYGAVQLINQAAETDSEDCSLTIHSAYSDGETVQISLLLDAPEDFSKLYSAIDAAYGGDTEATINGEEAQVIIVNPFYQREEKWSSTMKLALPEAQKDSDSLSISLEIPALTGRKKQFDTEQGSREEPLPGSFRAEFSTQVDRQHSFSFESQAEDNGAKVFSVSGTPAETAISIEKPFWGKVHENVPEDGSKGYPLLELMDGSRVEQYSSKTYKEGYDSMSTDTQNSTLYFDGLPAGTKQAVLRFYEDNTHGAVLAEFTIDLEAQTIVPSTTYDDGGALDLQNPTRYSTLQEGHEGQEQNGYTVRSVVITQEEELTGGVLFSFPKEQQDASLRVEAWDSKGNLLFSSDSKAADGTLNASWHLSPQSEYYEEDENGEKYLAETFPAEYAISAPIEGILVPIGETITTTITDLTTGKPLCTDTRTLTSTQVY